MVLQIRANDCSRPALSREKPGGKKKKTHSQKLSHDPVTFVTQFYNLKKKKKRKEMIFKQAL